MTYSLSDEEMTLAAGYVLGDLAPEEQRRFEALLRQNPALQTEVRRLETSLRLLPVAIAKVAAPPQLEDRILLAYQDAVAVNPIRAARTVPQRRSWAKLIAGIALLSALLLAADNLRLRQQLASLNDTSTDRVATILQQPNSRLVSLRSDTGTNAAGTLLFTPGQWQEVVVSLSDLPPLPPDQVYRMWLTLNNNQTIPCGEFNTNTEGSIFVKLNPPETPPKGTKATGIFVTIAPIDAPLQPTGERVLSGSI